MSRLFGCYFIHRQVFRPSLAVHAADSSDSLATHKVDFLGLDPAQLLTADLDTAPMGSLKAEELQVHLV